MHYRVNQYHCSRLLLSLAFFLVLPVFSGCGYIKYTVYKAHWGITFKGIPSMSAMNNLAPEESLIVGGRIIKPATRQGPLLLMAVNNKYRKNETVAVIQIPASQDIYMAFLPKGDYDLYIFADLNDSNDFESDEAVGRASVTVSENADNADAVQEGPAIALDLAHPMTVPFHVWERIEPTGYVYSSLDDKFFDPKHGTTGLYYPAELIYHNQGFVFGLEEYDPQKTTVLFVHGIAGTPRDWKFFVEGLDRTTYQPFFFYYPSGLPLDKLATLLARILDHIGSQNSHTKSIILVGHSMGGLIALSAIHKLSEAGLPSYLKMYCSFSTPYGGSEMAQQWASQAPIKVPAWVDISAKSTFIRTLTQAPLPEKLPFYLFFSFKSSSGGMAENNDGAISIRSQLHPSQQFIATRVFGFNETHMGILKSEEARTLFFDILNGRSGKTK